MQSESLLQRTNPEREVIFFVLFVTSYIWLWQRAFPGALFVAIGGGLLLIAISNLLHRDPAHSLGLRLDNVPRSLLEVGLMTLALIALLLVSGWLLGTLRTPEWWKLRSVGWHYFWAFVQQYALQAFVLTRLRQVYGDENTGALAAAGWFAFLHLPNPPLTVMTFVTGYVWCRLFQRQPNLFTLALSHTILAIVTVHSFPRAWMHSMKVGPGYFNF
jgi:hypothetical protein